MSPEPQIQTSPFDYVDAFLATVESSSYPSCKSALKCFREFVLDTGRDPCSLGKEDVEAWKARLDEDQKPSSVNRRLVALNAFYRWLSGQTGCPNIVDGVKRHPNQPVNKRKAFSPEQVESLVLAVSNCRTYKEYRDKAILHVLLRTGLCNAQVRNLRIDDLVRERDRAILRVKTRRGYVLIPLSPELTGYIEDYLEQRRKRRKYFPDSPLFSNVLNRGGVRPNGKMDSTTVTTAIERILKRAGIDEKLGEYSFPFTAMSLAAKEGASIKEIYELSVMLGIPKRFFLELEMGSTALSPYDSVNKGVERAEAEARKGVLKCSDLRRALDSFSDDELLEIRIDESGDLRIVPIMKISKISFGMVR